MSSVATLSVGTHNNLRIDHGPSGDHERAIIVRFTPETDLKILGSPVGEVTLVFPTQ